VGKGEGGKTEPGDETDGTDAIPLPKGTAELIVEVVDRAGEPRPGMVVALLYGRASEEVPTDEEGLAVFGPLAKGNYSFRVKGEEVPDLESAKDVTLLEGEQKQITLTIGSFDSELSGRVRNRDGEPVPGIRIFAYKQLFDVQEGDFIVGNH
jgi:hypothetical protein